MRTAPGYELWRRHRDAWEHRVSHGQDARAGKAYQLHHTGVDPATLAYPNSGSGRHFAGMLHISDGLHRAKCVPILPEVKGKRWVAPTLTVSFVPHLFFAVAQKVAPQSPSLIILESARALARTHQPAAE